MNVILVGGPGSGKGTQAEIMTKKTELCHISTGDLFRQLEGDLKVEVDEIMAKGDLVPDELTVKILKERMEKPDCEGGVILDGFPRTLAQADLLKDICDVDLVIEIRVSDDALTKRISGRARCSDCGAGYNIYTAPKPLEEGKCDKCGGDLTQRKDDTLEAAKNRIELFHKQTKPILEYYGDKVKVIDGERGIEEISEDILKILN